MIFGSTFALGFRSLRKSLSPTPHAKLRPSGARPWSRLRDISLHGFTNIHGVPLVEDRQTMTYDTPFQPDQGGVIFDDQAQAFFGSTFPTPDSSFGPMDVPQTPFGSTPPQSTGPIFMQQGGAPAWFEEGTVSDALPEQLPFSNQNMQAPAQNDLFSEDQLRQFVQDRLIVPPEQRNQEEW